MTRFRKYFPIGWRHKEKVLNEEIQNIYTALNDLAARGAASPTIINNITQSIGLSCQIHAVPNILFISGAERRDISPDPPCPFPISDTGVVVLLTPKSVNWGGATKWAEDPNFRTSNSFSIRFDSSPTANILFDALIVKCGAGILPISGNLFFVGKRSVADPSLSYWIMDPAAADPASTLVELTDGSPSGHPLGIDPGDLWPVSMKYDTTWQIVKINPFTGTEITIYDTGYTGAAGTNESLDIHENDGRILYSFNNKTYTNTYPEFDTEVEESATVAVQDAVLGTGAAEYFNYFGTSLWNRLLNNTIQFTKTIADGGSAYRRRFQHSTNRVYCAIGIGGTNFWIHRFDRDLTNELVIIPFSEGLDWDTAISGFDCDFVNELMYFTYIGGNNTPELWVSNLGGGNRVKLWEANGIDTGLEVVTQMRILTTQPAN